MSEMDEIIREFLVESNEGLDHMDRDLVELEKNPADHELLASIFRAIHTIKGTSGVLGFQRSEAVAHVGENLLSRLRDGKLRLTPQMTTVLLAMADVLRAKLGQIEATGREDECDDSQIIAAVSGFLCPENAEESSRTGQTALIGKILEESGVMKSEIDDALQQQKEGDPRRLGEILVSNGAARPDTVLDALNRQSEPHSVTVSSNIRVDVGLLDKVMNLVGELVLARNRVLQFTATQKDQAFLSTAQRLNLITTELQEGVMKTRMQPIGNVWNKFPRLVRDLAASCGKQVRIELHGSETELDKTIIEAIKDPLTHIVRNSIDHGIEDPTSRQGAGKTPEGKLLLRAFHEGGQVNIEIEDDGCGIDLDRVKQKALTKGLVTAERLAQMTERELTSLIFLPGFRIRGAILDSLRDLDWSPRDLRRKARRLEDVASKLGSALGRAATEQELAAELSMNLVDFQHMLTEISGLDLTSLQVESPTDGQEQDLAEHLPADPDRSPFSECLRDEMKRALAEGIAELPEREQQVLSLYYFEELTMKEVGAVLGVGESRVSQMHSIALVRLRARLRQLQTPSVSGPVIAAANTSEAAWTRY